MEYSQGSSPRTQPRARPKKGDFFLEMSRTGATWASWINPFLTGSVFLGYLIRPTAAGCAPSSTPMPPCYPLADAYYTASLRAVGSKYSWSSMVSCVSKRRPTKPYSRRGLRCWRSVTPVNGQTEPKRSDFQKSHTIKIHSVSTNSSVLIHWGSVISISQSNFIRLS